MNQIHDPSAGVRVLLIEDSPEQAVLVKHWLEQWSGCEVVHASDGPSGAQFAQFGTWDLVVSDIELPGVIGLDLIKIIKGVNPWTPVLMITAHPKMEYAVTALQNRADGILFKPLDYGAFMEQVQKLVAEGQKKRREEQKTVLAIGAHPDDVEIGCGGTLLRHKAAGDRVVILTLTGGEFGGRKSLRVIESEKAASVLGAELFMGELRDTQVSEGPETISIIESTIRVIQPTHVYTHTPNDAHQDHRNCYRATIVAARGIPNLYCYQAPSTTIDFRPTMFIEVGRFMDGKIKAINAYHTQTAIRAYLKEDLIMATARYWGRFSGYGYSEPMEVVRQQG
ncbi:MAG: PIG-L family deacetylase [Bacteroidetes Order II. Incertae sedis bacterium]|nr:PIG-L family deacetylase [Bacteroidetes Order II. bacterium]HRR08939.1 PIG-L family deacetylase [Rhodothermales bacterium]